MVEIKIEVWEESGEFVAKTHYDIDEGNDIIGRGETPEEALEDWLVKLKEQEFFRPD